MTAKELAGPFGAAPSAASSKGAQIKKLLKIDYYRADYDRFIEVAQKDLPEGYSVWIAPSL